MGVAAAHEGLPQGANHDAAGRRVQEPQRDRAQDAGHVRQSAAVHVALPVRRHQASAHEHRHRARERGGRVRRHRAPPDESGGAVPEADLAPRQQADHPVRLRVRAREQTQKSHVFHQRQHHEDHGRPVPPDVQRDRRRVSGHRARALDRRHRRGQDGRHARSVRRDRDAESVRRCALRRRGPDHGLGRARGLRQHRRPLLDVRGHSRLGAAPRGPEPGQPLRPVARRDPDARPHRPGRCCGAGAQRLAAHDRGRRPYLRHLQGRHVAQEGGDEGVRRRGRSSGWTASRSTSNRPSTTRSRR